MRQFAARSAQIERRGVALVRVFHSPVESLASYATPPHAVPFPVLADPTRGVYRAYGVGRSWLALLAPAAWKRGREALRAGLRPRWRDAIAHGIGGAPADFLIDAGGTIELARYGAHLADSITVGELLTKLDQQRPRPSGGR